MNTKKTIVILMVAIMLVSLFVTGCTSKDTNDEEGTSEGTVNNSEGNAGNDTDDSEVADVDTSEPITLSVMFSSHPWTSDAETIPMFNEVAEKMNITIEWDQVRSGWDEKKSTVLASGDLPDVFFVGLGDGDIITNMDNFYELGEYVDKYAPNVKKMFEEEPITKKISTFPDGNIYSLPSLRMYRPESVNIMIINREWLDNLGLQAPTTLDELEKVLIEFRDKDPNQNQQKDEIPLDFVNGRGYFSINSLAGSFGVVDNMTGEMLTVENGEVGFLFAREEYKNLVSYLHKLYSQDLINKEVFTQDYSQMMAKAQDPEAAKVGVTLGWSIVDRVGPDWAPQYYILLPLKTEGVDNPLFPSNPPSSQMGTNLFSMTKSNKHPERTMLWINEFYGEEMSAQGYYGSFDVGVKKNADGTYEQLPPEEEGYSQDRWMWTHSLVDGAPMYGSKDLESRMTIVPELMTRVEHDNLYKPYYPDHKDIYPLVKLEKSAVDELSLINADLYNLVDQKNAEWIVKGGIEEEWDNYIKQLEQIGMERALQIYQEGYDRFYQD